MLAAALIASALAGLATTVGALPFLLAGGVPRRAYDALLGVGAGLMMSAATLGLLQHALEQVRTPSDDPGRFIGILIGFVAGAALMAALDRFVPHQHAAGHPEHVDASERRQPIPHGHEHRPGDGADDPRLQPSGRHSSPAHQGVLLTGGVILHRIPEGLAIGAAFAHTGGLGTLLTVAIAVQNVCEGVILAAPLRRAGVGRARLLGIVTATGFVLPLAAGVGMAVSTHVHGALPILLALASGALLYLVSNEVIPESHSHGNEGVATVGLMVGFLVTVVLQAVTGHHS